MRRNIFYTGFFVLLSVIMAACNPPFQPSFSVCRGLDDYPVASAAGFDYLEPTVGGFLAPGKSDSAFQANLAKQKALGVKIISCVNFLPGDYKVTGDATRHDDILAWAEVTFRRAQEAGIPHIVFGSGGARKIPDGFDREEAIRQFVDLGKKLAPIAERYGVTVVVEPLNKRETNLINSLAEGAAIVHAIDHPNVRLLCDIYHMMREDEPAEEIVKYGELIRHCHIAERENRTAPGTVGDDFRSYFAALKKIGYRGCISIECSWGDDFAAQTAMAYQYLQTQYE